MQESNVYVLKELDKYESLTEYLQACNYAYETRVLEQKVIEANRWVARKLEIPLAAKVFSLKRLRIVEGVPRCIDQVYIAYHKVEGIETLALDQCSFYSILRENYHIQIKRSEEELAIADASKEECELLELDDGDEVMVSTGITYLEDGSPMEYFEIVARTDFYHFRSVNILEDAV